MSSALGHPKLSTQKLYPIDITCVIKYFLLFYKKARKTGVSLALNSLGVKRKQYFWLIFLFFLFGIAFSQTKEECDELLVKGIREMNEKNHEKSLETLTQVKSIAEKNNWQKQNFLAVNNIGANYYWMLDYGEALENYLEAYKIAVKDLDQNFEMIVLNNIAILYSKEKKFEKAEGYFLNAYKLAEEGKDSTKIGLYAVNLATVANERNEPAKAENYLQTAFKNLDKNSPILAQAFVSKAQNLVLKNQLIQAKELIDSVLPSLSTPELSEPRISAQMLLSQIAEKQNQFLDAIELTKLARFDPQSSLEDKIEAYGKLSELNRKLNRNDLGFLYKDSVILAKDSLNVIKNGKQFENSRIKFEIQNYQKELSESQKRLKDERKIFYFIIGGIIVLIIILFWALRNYFLKMKQRKIIAERNQKIAELELEKQSRISSIETNKLKNEIETQNRKLATKALSYSARNELIENILVTLTQQSGFSQNNHLRKQIQELKMYLKKESDWDDFFMHFEAVNHGFIQNLKFKHPELNSNDVRYLSYVYMNLTTKEISSLLNITVEACRKRKERIIKKMDLDEEMDLYYYLSTV